MNEDILKLLHPPPGNAVADDEARTLCQIGQGPECCRYLSVERTDYYLGFVCEKHTELAAAINERVAIGQFLAHGDHCPGRKP